MGIRGFPIINIFDQSCYFRNIGPEISVEISNGNCVYILSKKFKFIIKRTGPVNNYSGKIEESESFLDIEDQFSIVQ